MADQPKQYPPLVPLILEGKGPFCLIGDIHGCFDELVELVARVIQFTGQHQEDITWISLGDVCDRGPKVSECFRLLRNIKAHIVIGNHDEKLLRWRKGNKVHIGASQQVSLDSLRDQDWEQFAAMVPFVRIPFYGVVGVHGGFFNGVPLEKQDLKQIIRLRYIDPIGQKMYTLAEGDGDKGVFWGEVWGGPEHVIFGHAWAKEIQQYPHATGIDTGCVYGNKLSAMVLQEDVCNAPYLDTRERTLIQVPARKQYWAEHPTRE